MRHLSRAAVILALALAVPLVLLVVADLVATAVAEFRLSAAVSDALGRATAVELGPWPATPRLLAGDLVVDVETASGDGDGSTMEVVHVRLTGVELAEGWRSFTAEAADVEATLDPAQAPFGVSTATGTATDVRATFASASSTITVGQVDLQSGVGTSASASRLRVQLHHPGESPQRTALTAVTATVEATEDLGAARLPMDLGRLQVEFTNLDLLHGDDVPTRVRATRADLEADGLPLEGSGVRLETLVATLPALSVDHPEDAEQLVVSSDGATFTAELGEQDLTELWPGPGNVELVDGVVRLSIGPLAIDVEVQADGRQLQLTPLLPPALGALFGDVPSVAVTPQLPQGVTLSEVTVAPGTLLLGGGGDRIVVPLE